MHTALQATVSHHTTIVEKYRKQIK
ncbi:hypothetical protein A2U01_0078588, partial [Trifolium medium]|nr:hypothetical protein [Trifolium medium]